MKYTEIQPGQQLRSYVKCYFLFESEDSAGVNDTVFPGGNMEIIFNLGEGIWKSAVNDTFQTTPPVELWGQITRPLLVQAVGKNKMLGIRFFPHSAAFFLNEELWEFNNQIADLRDLLGASIRELHARLMDESSLPARIALLENFLHKRLLHTEKKHQRIARVGRIIHEINQNEFADTVESVASRHDITPRYLQKLFLQHTGVTPQLFKKINRFQRSLKLLQGKRESLTSVAYDCGYFDQSHFIREFKSFTGITPSAYQPDAYPVTQLFASA
jgi:AraC-like DNA-binding protein